MRRAVAEQEATLRRLSSGVEALVRRTFLDGLGSEDGQLDVVTERFGMTSQGEEDGIVVALLRRVGVTHRRAVEIGCGPNGGNAGLLARELRWSTLMVDADTASIKHVQRAFAGTPTRAVQEWVTAENVNELLEREGFGSDVDYFGLDVDGNDYWVWSELALQPRVAVLEFNPAFGAESALTIPYDPTFDWSRRTQVRAFFGASLAALELLGKRKGYRLVATDPQGANAFFVRESLAGESLPVRTAAELWRPPRKGGMHEPLRHPGGVRAWFAEHGCELVDVSADADSARAETA
jgi:hypothetical protein